MKFRVIVRNFQNYGGAEVIALRFADFLYKEGLLKEVLCGRSSLSKSYPVKEVGYLKPGRFFKTFTFQKRAVKYIKENEERGVVNFAFSKVPYCHVFRNGGGTHLGFLKASIEAYKGAEKLLKRVRRRLNPVNYLNPLLEEEIFKTSKAIVAISSIVKDEVLEFYGHLKLEDKIFTVPNPVNKERFSPEVKEKLRERGREFVRAKKGEFVLGFASSNFKLKGLREALFALKYLPERVKLVVAGGRNPKEYLKLAKKLNLKGRVLFLGKVSQMELFYSGIDLFLHPSYYDTFANVVAEALATGTPVICSAKTGAKEFVKEEVSGFVLKEITPEEIGRKVKEALSRKWKFKVELPTDEEVFRRYVEIGEQSLSQV
ncbi:glycosyltransferase family 4 protein [Thermovibrio sp.]